VLARPQLNTAGVLNNYTLAAADGEYWTIPGGNGKNKGGNGNNNPIPGGNGNSNPIPGGNGNNKGGNGNNNPIPEGIVNSNPIPGGQGLERMGALVNYCPVPPAQEKNDTSNQVSVFEAPSFPRAVFSGKCIEAFTGPRIRSRSNRLISLAKFGLT
jgi:hypothetical protein